MTTWRAVTDSRTHVNKTGLWGPYEYNGAVYLLGYADSEDKLAAFKTVDDGVSWTSFIEMDSYALSASPVLDSNRVGNALTAVFSGWGDDHISFAVFDMETETWSLLLDSLSIDKGGTEHWGSTFKNETNKHVCFYIGNTESIKGTSYGRIYYGIYDSDTDTWDGGNAVPDNQSGETVSYHGATGIMGDNLYYMFYWDGSGNFYVRTLHPTNGLGTQKLTNITDIDISQNQPTSRPEIIDNDIFLVYSEESNHRPVCMHTPLSDLEIWTTETVSTDIQVRGDSTDANASRNVGIPVNVNGILHFVAIATTGDKIYFDRDPGWELGEQILQGSEAVICNSANLINGKVGVSYRHSNDGHTTYYGEYTVADDVISGGSEATVNVSAEGSGEKTVSGSSETVVNISAEGNGIKAATGSSESVVTVEAEGAGEVGVITFEGGSESQVIVLAEAAGVKRARSPPAEAEVITQAEGTGEKTGQGSSESTVEISAEGAGVTVKQGGSESTVEITGEGQGSKVISGSSEATVTVSGEGAGQKAVSGASESTVEIAATGAGEKAVSGSSEGEVSVNAEGGGHEVVPDYAEGGSQAEVTINAEGAGEAFRQGSSESEVTVSAEGAGQVHKQGSSQSEVSVSTEGEGRKAADGGSDSTVRIAGEGTGTKSVSGGSEGTVSIAAEGAGETTGQAGGSESRVTVSAEGAGISVKQGSSEAGITVATEGEGHKVAEGSGETTVTVSAEGAGTVVEEKSGGSEASVNVSAEGSGVKVASHSSEADVSISSEGRGQKQSAGGEEAAVIVITEGQGQKHSEGSSEASVIVSAEGLGEIVVPYVQLTITLEVLDRPVLLELLERETSLSILERETLLQVLERSTELTVLERSVSLEVEGLPKIGTTVRLQGAFRDLDNSLTDMDNDEVKLKVYDGSRTIIESEDCARSSEGVYYYDLVVPEGAGPVYWEMSGEMGGLPIVDRDKLEREW